jgi:hypothetical protein
MAVQARRREPIERAATRNLLSVASHPLADTWLTTTDFARYV